MLTTTRYKTVKDHADVKLEGVDVEIEKADTMISAIAITDKAGNKLLIRVKDYSVSVLVPAPVPTVDRWRLAFSLKGIQVDELYSNDYLALTRWRDLTDGGISDNPPDGTIKKVQVPEETPVNDKHESEPPAF